MNRLLGKFLMLSVTLKSLEAVNTKVAVRADGALDLAYSQVVAADAAITAALELTPGDRGNCRSRDAENRILKPPQKTVDSLYRNESFRTLFGPRYVTPHAGTPGGANS